MANKRIGGTCILVLGAHRSGTSSVTACLGALGCALGDPDMGPDDQNPRGYFEHYAIMALNNALLDRAGARWDSWTFDPSKTDFSSTTFDDLRAEALTLLDRTFGGAMLWAIKDPRISMLLPFWEPLLASRGVSVRRILVVRAPLEVAASEIARIPAARRLHTLVEDERGMHILWCATHRALLNTLGGDETLIVLHRALMSDPQGQVDRVARFIGVEDTGLIAEAAALIEPSLHRRRGPPADDSQPWHGLSAQLYAALAAAGDEPALERETARSIWREQRPLQQAFALIAPFESAMRQLRGLPAAVNRAEGVRAPLLWFAMQAAQAVPERQLGDAAERIEGVLEHFPGAAPLWSALGVARSRAGEQEKAGVALAKALALAPGNAEIQRRYAEFNQAAEEPATIVPKRRRRERAENAQPGTFPQKRER